MYDVPFVEAGYPGNLSLAKIAEVLEVDAVRSPPRPHPADL